MGNGAVQLLSMQKAMVLHSSSTGGTMLPLGYLISIQSIEVKTCTSTACARRK